MRKQNENILCKKNRKKLFCKIVLTLVFLTVLSTVFCVNALDYINEDWTFSVSYLGNAGEYYSLFAVEGDHTLTDMPTVTEENLIYINQQTAEETGFVDFAGFSPMRESIATLYIGGSNLDAPICLGRISDATFELVYTNNKIVFVYNSQRELVEYHGHGEKVKIPEGTRRIYDIGIFENKGVTEIVYPSTVLEVAKTLTGAKSYYNPRFASGFNAISPEDLGQSIFIISDHNNDGKVDYSDLQYFLKNTVNREKYPADATQSDVNSDGTISLSDIRELMHIISSK